VTRLRLIATTLLAAAVLSGCGAKSAVDPGVPVNGVTRVLADGRLVTNPPPLTLEDVNRRPVGSPAYTVMSLLFWAQWGSPANIAAEYDPGVARLISVSNLVGAWESIRQSIVTSLPKIVFERINAPRNQAFIGLLFETTLGPPTRQSFVLRRMAGGWRIVYDTLLESALPGYVAEQVTPNPLAKHDSGAAIHRGLGYAADYRAYWAQQVVSSAQNGTTASATGGANVTAAGGK
jgi:hypothetical protein